MSITAAPLRLVRGAALALTLGVAGLAAGCATTDPYDASADVHDFLLAIRNGDRARFEQHVDRPALQAQLRSRVLQSAVRADGGRPGLFTLGAALARPATTAVADALIQPEVFLTAAQLVGVDPDAPPPSRGMVSAVLRPVDKGLVCALASGQNDCLFTFQLQGNTWRLVRFDGDIGLLTKR